MLLSNHNLSLIIHCQASEERQPTRGTNYLAIIQHAPSANSSRHKMEESNLGIMQTEEFIIFTLVHQVAIVAET